MRRVCVFCGASSGRSASYADAARAFGAAAASRGLGVVYGGGRVGLMGAVADGALAAGGEVIGVIPQELVDRELAHGGLTELHVVGSLHERKALMAELADAFVALPGGFGTLDELLEQLTWSQLGLHAKPIGLLDVDGYWRPLIALARHATDEGFVREADLAAIAVADDPNALLDRLERLTQRTAPAPQVDGPAGAVARSHTLVAPSRSAQRVCCHRTGRDQAGRSGRLDTPRTSSGRAFGRGSAARQAARRLRPGARRRRACSNVRSKTSANACAAAGRTSSTETGRPSSRAIDVNW